MRNFSKRFLTMLLAVAMVFSLSGMTALAADGDVSTYDVGEEPTLNSDGYYEIATPENLEWFADQVNNVEGQNAIDGIVTADIDVSDSESFSPIGMSASICYSGNFDGAGHTITLNLNNTDADYQALFGYTSGAAIRNVTVDGSVSGSAYVAGVIGRASDSTVIGCVNEAAITSTGNYTGGVVAFTDNNITDCGNDGPVTSSEGVYVGGVLGYTNKNGVEVSGCYNHGDIEGYRTVAGIVGESLNSITIDSCYNTGVINTTVSNVGSNTYCSAGIVGIIQGGSVSNVFNTGDIAGKYPSFMGALTGGATSMYGGHSITNGYYLEGTADSAYASSGFANSNVTLTNVSAKTAAEIKSADFLDLINENDAFVRGADYPILKWEYDESGSVDKSALQAEYDEDIQITDIGYTSERWETFTEALEAAKTVLDTPEEETTQLDVDTALYDLQLAKANLNVPLQNGDGQYEIANVVTLEWFADQVNNAGKNSIDGIVTADIDASGSESFSPIGTTDSNFTGTFDGDGHTITLNLTDTDSDYQALFGYTYTAAISNVTVDGSVSGRQYVAGIIAYMNGSNISGCVNRAAITGAAGDVGGVVGYAYTRNGLGVTNGFITNCGNDGAITSSGNSVGGIVGDTKADGNESTAVSGCYNHADIIAQYDIGGIVGYGSSATSVDSCYNTGNITETGTSGNNSYCSGGLVGMFSGSTPVSNSFNMGTVTGGNDTRQRSMVGALLGGGTSTGASARLDHAYFLEGSCAYGGEDRYSASSSQGGVTVLDDSVSSKTAEEMTEIVFLDLINANLAFTQGTDYPILKWETEERTSYMALREEYQDDLLLDWADYT
ncbi:MAG: FIVAR domain-containing protein, partial [Bacteroidales bacterium]|nr:FIVAR domain-containing protein [Bacteroidales bacterium]